MGNYQFYIVEKKPPVAWVYLNRPEKKNAMNPPAWREALPIFEDLDRDDDIRAVVISGKGPCFSAGIDLMEMAAELPELMESGQKGGVKRSLLHKIYPLQDTMSCIEWCRKPVIAAIHGYCIGAGLDMATACDIRICTQDAQFCLKEAAVGFVADVGVLQRIPLIVGQGLARELAYTAKRIDAQRAREILLVNDIFADHDFPDGGGGADGRGNRRQFSPGGPGLQGRTEFWRGKIDCGRTEICGLHEYQYHPLR